MSVIKASLIGASLVITTAVVALPVHATSDSVPGNNGTLKVHEKDTPRNTENNDPKVCTFNFEGYGFDNGQDGVIITKQGSGNDRTEVKRLYMPKSVGADQHSTFTETEYITLADDHYKTTVYGKENMGEYKVELKAKSKVIKVECDTTDTNGGGNNNVNNSSNNGGGQGSTTNNGNVAGTSTSKTTSPAGGQGVTAPITIAATGGNPFQTILNTLLMGAGVYSALLRRKQ